MSDAVKKVVLAYSGGLDTSVILRWLQQTYRCEVVTFTADLALAAIFRDDNLLEGFRARYPGRRLAVGWHILFDNCTNLQIL